MAPRVARHGPSFPVDAEIPSTTSGDRRTARGSGRASERTSRLQEIVSPGNPSRAPRRDKSTTARTWEAGPGHRVRTFRLRTPKLPPDRIGSWASSSPSSPELYSAPPASNGFFRKVAGRPAPSACRTSDGVDLGSGRRGAARRRSPRGTTRPNPSVLIAAGLLAKKARGRSGLTVRTTSRPRSRPDRASRDRIHQSRHLLESLSGWALRLG